MFRSRLTFQDKEAGLMTMITTSIAPWQRLLSQARILGWKGLSGSWLLTSSAQEAPALTRDGREDRLGGSAALKWLAEVSGFLLPFGQVAPQQSSREAWEGGSGLGAACALQLVSLGSLKVRKEDGGSWQPQAWHVPRSISACLQEIEHFFQFCAWLLWLPLYSLWYRLFHSLG